jgi:nucleoid-associated protein YgaU
VLAFAALLQQREELLMSIISFIKDAGEKLFGIGKAQAATQEAAADPTPDKVKAANDAAGDAILDYIRKMNLDATGLTVTFDAASGTADVYGIAQNQSTREKIVLCCGNVAGVARVNDNMTVDVAGEPEAIYHTVVRGDTLSAIAKKTLGNANRYPEIFEANKPMLTHPDKIYPGQVLRIPGGTAA